MRIAINAVAVRGGGGERYLLNIVKALVGMGSPHEFWVILGRWHGPLVASLPGKARAIVCDSVPRQSWLRMGWEQAILPVLLRRWDIDLLFAAYNNAVLLSHTPTVLLVHNANPYSRLAIPWSIYGRARHVALRGLGLLSSRVARTVVFVSHASARVMAPRLGISTSRVRVVHHGWLSFGDSTEGESWLRRELPACYVLAVSDLQPHKNLEVLLRAFERLVAEGAYPGDLVIVGGRREMSSKYAERLLARCKESTCAERVHFVGDIPHHMLPLVYRGADLFAFPSLEETFGFPLVEAMGEGIPVIAADWRLAPGGEQERLNVGPEICGNAAEFFDPTSSDSLAGAMQRVLMDHSRRAELARMGQIRAKEFSWDKAAAALLAIFEEAASPTASAPRMRPS